MGELIVQGLKYALYIAIAVVFASAVMTLLNLILTIVLGSIIGEVLGAVSMFLPFNAYDVFNAVGTSLNAILAFFCGRAAFCLINSRISF